MSEVKSSNQLPTLRVTRAAATAAIPNMGKLRNVCRGTSQPKWAPLRFKDGATVEPRNSSLARLSRIKASLHHPPNTRLNVWPWSLPWASIWWSWNWTEAGTISLCGSARSGGQWRGKDLREAVPRHTGHAMP